MACNEDEYLLLSGLQHFEFCPRQWALIHIEQQWNENVLTVEGRIMHDKAHDKTFNESRGDVIITRSMAVKSAELGITGECDVVEFQRDEKGVPIFGREGRYTPVPVEYKRGKPKDGDEDVLQLTAQAMCLEEMLCCRIEQGYLYYGEMRKRVKVALTDELREKVKSDLVLMHQYYKKRHTPKVKPAKRCNACSLKDLCVPKLMKNVSVESYIDKMLGEDGEDE
jgi:CRISPR-associated exonuclease Cas4